MRSLGPWPPAPFKTASESRIYTMKLFTLVLKSSINIEQFISLKVKYTGNFFRKIYGLIKELLS